MAEAAPLPVPLPAPLILTAPSLRKNGPPTPPSPTPPPPPLHTKLTLPRRKTMAHPKIRLPPQNRPIILHQTHRRAPRNGCDESQGERDEGGEGRGTTGTSMQIHRLAVGFGVGFGTMFVKRGGIANFVFARGL